MRVFILWKQLSGHSGACFRALASAGVEASLVYRAATPDAPYDEDHHLRAGLPGHQWRQAPDERRILAEVDAFEPDALLVCSWDVGAYRRVSRALRGRTLRVLCMDNAWLATPKQWAGRIASPLVIRPTYDVAFLPGERQAAFARRLGFKDDRILWGFYSCDHPAFAAVADGADAASRNRFVFVGRLAPEKGVDVLARAYDDYRRRVEDPWPLLVCGTGPLAARLADVPGVTSLGFVQPADLPAALAQASCLVLPSRFEPWGVVIHEAAAAGLSVVCSTACGASTRLVLDGYNGVVVPPGDSAALAEAMTRISTSDAATRAEMARRSRELAGQFTPERWARYLVERIPPLRAAMGLGS